MHIMHSRHLCKLAPPLLVVLMPLVSPLYVALDVRLRNVHCAFMFRDCALMPFYSQADGEICEAGSNKAYGMESQEMRSSFARRHLRRPQPVAFPELAKSLVILFSGAHAKYHQTTSLVSVGHISSHLTPRPRGWSASERRSVC